MNKVKLMVLALGMVFVSSQAFAAQVVEGPHQVDFVVNGVLSIADDGTDAFTLTFADYEIGDISTNQQISYHLKSNKIVDTALDGVVAANVDALVYGIDLECDFVSYTTDAAGSPTNVVLTEHTSGWTTIDVDGENIAKKAATTGSQKKMLRGDLVLDFRGKATEDLTAGTYSTNLTVTLKDA